MTFPGGDASGEPGEDVTSGETHPEPDGTVDAPGSGSPASSPPATGLLERVKPAAVSEQIGSRFTSRLHEPRTAAILGIALGVSFTVCFVTGLLSHLIQYPPGWFFWPTRPAGLYRINQGVHTITGFVSIPLLLAKLWVVFPKLFEWPPARSVAKALERLALLPLVGGGVFMLMSGTANLARWYPWRFFFPTAHYAVAWITMGALIVHLGAKWSIVRSETGRVRSTDDPTVISQRRNFLAGVAGTAGLVFLATAGSTIRPLSGISALAQRRPGTGPQGVPVNKSARGAGVQESATDPNYRLRVSGTGFPAIELSVEQLRAMPQRTAVLPISCVEGWSTSAEWRGVPVRALLDAAGAPRGSSARVQSLQKGGRYSHSVLATNQVDDLDTMLALELNGEPLHIDHGAPVRLIGPDRPGVQQTKWVAELVAT